MRFDEFVLRVPGEEFRLRFHEQLTVLAGVGALERQALIAALVGSLTGDADSTTLTCIDHTGRAVELTNERGTIAATYLDDGSVAPAPIGWFTADVESLRSLLVLTAADVGPAPSEVDDDDDPQELKDARAALRAIAAEVAAATDAHNRFQVAAAALDHLDAMIRATEEDSARRAYARVLAELERVRAEADAIEVGADADRQLLASVEQASRLAAQRATLSSELERARAGAGAVAVAEEVLDPVDVVRLAGVPDEAPPDLPALVAALVRAGEHVVALEDRLRQVASAGLDEPEDERVVTLATLDQAALWAAHDRAVAAEEAVGHEHVAVGGLGAQGDRAEAIEELEASHWDSEKAHGVIDRRRVPVIAGAGIVAGLGVPFGAVHPVLGLLLCAAAAGGAAYGIGGPWRARTAAQKREAAALERVGVSTYLSFHLRRIDATLDPTALDRLDHAEAARAAAGRAWAAVSGGVELEVATALRPQIEAYATALAAQHGAVQEVAELRRTLDELALPDLGTARARVVTAVEPYGLGATDLDGLEPELVLALVDHQVTQGHAARRQELAEHAESDAEAVTSRLEELLASLGFVDGELDVRLGAMAAAVEQARTRDEARATARPAAVVQADLHRLNAEVRRLHRPEWSDVTSSAAAGPDIAELVEQRAAVVAELAAAREAVGNVSNVDVEVLSDRHAAAERRVRAFEAQVRADRGDGADLDEVHKYLLGALTKANCVGPLGEPVPVLLDDPFVRVPAERKWELMDMLRRLSEKTQLLYLTDDPFVGAWARRRADSGEISLLEPVD